MTDNNLNNEKKTNTVNKPEPDISSKIENKNYIVDKPNFLIGLIDVIKSIFK